jgi:hypothetical protein
MYATVSIAIVPTISPYRNLIPGKPPKKALPSIMKVSLWATRSVLSYPTVVDGPLSMPGILAPVSSAAKWDIGPGLIYQHSLTLHGTHELPGNAPIIALSESFEV